MNVTFKDWHNQEKGEDMYSIRIEEYFTGFEPIAWTHDGQEAYFDTVRVLAYLNEEGSQVEQIEYVPWKDGREVENAVVPNWLKERMEEVVKGYQLSSL